MKQSLVAIISKIFVLISSVLSLLIGEISWRAPKWLILILGGIVGLPAFLKTQHKNNKSKFYGSLAGIAIVFGSTFGGYYWYINRPQPVRLSVEASSLSATPLREDAKPETLVIEFGGSAAKLESIEKTVEKGIVISPDLEGRWVWKEDNKLVFTVAGDWPIDQTLKIKLDRELFPKHVHLEMYELEVATPKFSAEIYDFSFYQSPKDPKEKRVVAELRFSHPVDSESLKKNIEFIYKIGQGKGRKVKEKKVNFEVSYDKFFGRAYLKSEVLEIPNYESKLEMVVGDGIHSSLDSSEFGKELSGSTTVPGMLDHFQFTSADLTLVRNEKYEPEQVLVLSTTARVAQDKLGKNLEVYLLPETKAGFDPRDLENRSGSWRLGDIGQKVLQASTEMELVAIPTENKYSEVISYKYQANPGRYLYIRVKKGLGAFGGYRLPESKSFVVRVPSFPKELKIMAEGSILSLTGDKKLSILGRDLPGVRYTAKRLLPGQIAHFVTQSHGNLNNPGFDRYSFNLDNISETFRVIKPLPQTGLGKTQYSNFDFTGILRRSGKKPKGLFMLTAQGWDLENQSKTGPSESRFILVTDIGILTKRSIDGSYDVFLQSIATGRPIAGAKVEVLGVNGLPVVSKNTGPDGHVVFTGLDSFEDEKRPIVIVASKDQDLSFIPTSSHVNQVNYSRFDIGGVRTRSSSEKLEAYLFTDRGIYRPGEQVRLGYIMKFSDWSKSLEGTVVEIDVVGPRGNLVKRQRITKHNRFGLQDFKFDTAADWDTGRYSATLYSIKKLSSSGGRHRRERRTQLGSVEMKVEEFVPDRLKISAKFSVPANKGWLNPKDLKGLVNLQNLFGTPAQNRRIKAEISLTPSYPSFYSYKEWKFYDPMRSKKSFNEELGEKTTDEQGDAQFDLGLDKFESASYLLKLVAEGFEPEGGRSVLASNAVLISPLKYLVGIKAEGSLDYIPKDSKLAIDLIALDSNLEPLEVKGLKAKLVEFKQVSTLVKQPNGTFKYESVKKEYDLEESKISISKVNSKLSLKTSAPGDFALIVLNKDDLELNRVNYSVAGEANLSFELEKNAELQVRLNKTDYDPGEVIELNIRSPYVGAGLITIERERVYTYKWFQTSSKSSVQKIRIPSDLEGNGYINVTFVRSLDSNEIFMSPFSTGVAPFSINKSSRINKITMKVPELVRPGKTLAIKVSTQRRGKAIVFAVDEGILQVAKHKNPDPLNHFYKKRALEVTTKQILDLILPEFSKLSSKRSSDAGGAAGLLGKNLNPFKRKKDKAVAYWSGVVDVGPDSKTFKYEVPDSFAGRLRVMAVAVSSEAMDAASEKTLVKGHFVISPNVPTFAAPGDKLKVSVGVSNNVEGSGKGLPVQLKLASSKNIRVVGDSEKSLKIDEEGEVSTSFEVVAAEPLGNADLIFQASHKEKESRLSSTMSVRPASPFQTIVKLGYVEPKKTSTVETKRTLYKEFALKSTMTSTLPLGFLDGFKLYLEKYPYGCTEQVLSKSYPSLIFGGYKEYGVTKAKVSSQVQGVVEILGSRQLPEGGFMKWPGASEINAFHSAYAGLYLTEAKDRGYLIPKSTMDSLLSYLKDYSEREPRDLKMARVQAFAAYILTRNQMISTKSLVSLEKWLEGYEDKSWRRDVMVLFMAGSYKLMKADEKAQGHIDSFESGKEMKVDYGYGVFDQAIKHAFDIYIKALHFPQKAKALGSSHLMSLSNRLGRGFNTTSASISLLAFEAYARSFKNQSKEKVLARQLMNKSKELLQLKGDLFPKAPMSLSASGVEISNEGTVPAFYSVTQAGFDNKPSSDPVEEGIEVFRDFLGPEGEPIAAVKIGEELTVRIRMRSLKSRLYNMALVDILPGGFEVVLDSIDRDGGPEYIDVREDRVILFTSFTQEVKTFTYKIKAINKGKFNVPPTYSESMYDQSIYAKGRTGEISVE